MNNLAPRDRPATTTCTTAGSFLSAAAALYKITGETGYYDDSVLAADHVVSRQPILHHNARGENAWADQFVRALAGFCRDNHLQDRYQPWFAANADAAWKARRADKNVTWNDWRTPTALDDCTSFECLSMAVLYQVMGQPARRPRRSPNHQCRRLRAVNLPMIPTTSLIRARRLGRIAGAAGLFLWPLSVLAQQSPVNWPIPTLAPGTNPAAFPAPRNDWMAHFQRSLDRARQGHVDLVFDGDSITDFWLGTGKEVWTKNCGKLNAVDFGISGDRTENVLWRVDKGQLDGLKPKLVVLMIGTNNTGECSDVQIAEGVTAVLRAYQKACPASVVPAAWPPALGRTIPTIRPGSRSNGSMQSSPNWATATRSSTWILATSFSSPDGTADPRPSCPTSCIPAPRGTRSGRTPSVPRVDKVFQTGPPAP